MRRRASPDDVHHDGDSRQADQRTADESQHRHTSWNEAGRVHQVAEYQSVADADHEAWAEDERPITNGDERLASRDKRSNIRARSALAQRHDRKDTDDADRDKRGLGDASCDVSESEGFVLTLQDWEQHDGGADVGDDEDELADRAEAHSRVVACADEVLGGVQYRGVENECCDRGDEGDEKQDACDQGNPSG